MPKVKSKTPAVVFESRGTRLAINVVDLTRVDAKVRAMLLSGKVPAGASPIVVDRERPDESAVELICDLLTAASVADVIRAHDRRAGSSPTRVYLNKTGRWARVAGHAVLTLAGPSGVILNPEWFPEES